MRFATAVLTPPHFPDVTVDDQHLAGEMKFCYTTQKPLGIHSVDLRKMRLKDVDAGKQQDVGSNVA